MHSRRETRADSVVLLGWNIEKPGPREHREGVSEQRVCIDQSRVRHAQGEVGTTSSLQRASGAHPCVSALLLHAPCPAGARFQPTSHTIAFDRGRDLSGFAEAGG